MTDPKPTGNPPPDLPPEFAEAYLRGYQRAWETSQEPEPVEPQDVEPEMVEPEMVAQVVAPDPVPLPNGYESLFAEPVVSVAEPDIFADVEAEPWDGPSHRLPLDRPERPGWFVPALLATMVAVLLLAAFGIGKLFSDNVSSGSGNDDELTIPSIEPGNGKGDPDGSGKPSSGNPVKGKAWDGDTLPVSSLTAGSTCVLAPGTDAAGRRVPYTPDRATDGDFTTAWRCAGDGIGVTLRLDLGGKVRIGEVGLVPGYAKTDPQSKVDRYAENNRLTKVRWTFSDGRSVVQKLDGSASRRELQRLRIPPVDATSVTLEVLSSVRGPRNTIAVSEVELGETVG